MQRTVPEVGETRVAVDGHEQVRFGLTSPNGGTDFVLCSTDPTVASTLQRAEDQLAAGAVQPY